MFFANTNGIPRLEARTVTVGTTNVVYNFDQRAYVPARYSGLILFKLPSYTAPATALPIVFNTNGNQKELTAFNGVAVTSAELSGSGIILCYYENGTLQLLSSLTA